MNKWISTLVICAPLMTSFTYLVSKIYRVEKKEKVLNHKRFEEPGYNPFKDEAFVKKNNYILDIVLNNRGP